MGTTTYSNCTDCCDPGVSNPCCEATIPSNLTASDGAGGSVIITWDGSTGWAGTASGSFAGCTDPTVFFSLSPTCSGTVTVNSTTSGSATAVCSPFDWSANLSSPCVLAIYTISVTE